jgi:hypothetical protein
MKMMQGLSDVGRFQDITSVLNDHGAELRSLSLFDPMRVSHSFYYVFQ